MVQTFFHEEARISNGWTASGGEESSDECLEYIPRTTACTAKWFCLLEEVSGGESNTGGKDKQVSCTTLAVLQPIF